MIGIGLAQLQLVHRLIHQKDPKKPDHRKESGGTKNEQICGSSEDGRGTAKPSPHVLSQRFKLASFIMGVDQGE